MKKKYAAFEFSNSFWAYLNQPIFDRHYHAIFNPRKFCYQYRVQWLEFCLNRESIELLERCLDCETAICEDHLRSLPSNSPSSH
ncbi:MAG: hypothetical protein AAFY57_08235 [Cyanobacteria bacterium J06642_2]